MIRVVDGLIGMNEAKPIFREMRNVALLSENDWHLELLQQWDKTKVYSFHGTCFTSKISVENYWNQMVSEMCSGAGH